MQAMPRVKATGRMQLSSPRVLQYKESPPSDAGDSGRETSGSPFVPAPDGGYSPPEDEEEDEDDMVVLDEADDLDDNDDGGSKVPTKRQRRKRSTRSAAPSKGKGKGKGAKASAKRQKARRGKGKGKVSPSLVGGGNAGAFPGGWGEWGRAAARDRVCLVGRGAGAPLGLAFPAHPSFGWWG